MKYCPEIIKEITDNLSLGMGRVDTATLVGINFDTFCQWMQKPEFSEAIKKAELQSKLRCVGIIQKAAITTWQAAAWWLERKMPEEFALRNRLEHSGMNGAPIEINYNRKEMITILHGLVKQELNNVHKESELVAGQVES